ncbi:unnamed protein product [Prunus armeniaca]
MNIISWNARGAACTKFKTTVMNLSRTHHMDILFICEPRISGGKAIDVVKSLGFSNYEIVDANGFSGGLWLLWNASKVTIDIVGTSAQSISACVCWPGQTPWMFTGVYAHPCIAKRQKLWDYLSFVGANHNMPWLIAGDFNEMLRFEDKLGGASLCRLRGFKTWFDNHDMVDLGFYGSKYTWTNKKVFERLDRAICNLSWRRFFADATVRHLPRTKSDHSPIKICLASCFISSPPSRPFRFEAMWLQHENFQDVFYASWGSVIGSALDKSYALIAPLKQWNIQVFGHLRQRKNRLLARIDGIQKSLCLGPNRFLCNLEPELVKEFNDVLEQEAVFWRQKSRVNWLQKGDRNTKFFHLTTIIRRRRNKIERLKNIAGDWVEEAVGIKALAVTYFSDLFSNDHVVDSEIGFPNLFPGIDVADLRLLNRPVALEEVKASLFNIGGLKAPGIDGFPACFYQSQWNHCGEDIFQMVLKAFHECTIPEKLNMTLITLVPKVESPLSMVQFRPISLCSTLYKVISKVIVARLRTILPNLISPNQVSFVHGRHITDNILIAQELMHKFKLSKGKKGFMAWKIDLSKAYDRLNWNFIEHVLVELGLPLNLIKLIMSCVSTVKYQICINGELTESFQPKSGIRQGDPLSPYLFVLCIEKLSHIIFEDVRMGKWRPVKSSQAGPAVSHLFFADDLVLFAEATSNQARVLKNCLEVFCQASGQTVNFDKSAIFCSPNTCKEIAKEISCICGSPLTEDLGRYLGMPLLHSRIDKRTYSSLIDKVHKRLAAWKGKFLSLAGRATLIQSVTSAVPVYAMQTAKLPTSVCDALDKLNRNFFWGGSEKRSRVHLCQWDLVCRPKSKGGLGFKKTGAMNQALLAKIGWRLHIKDEGLWAKIYKAKYLKGHSILDDSVIFRQDCSSTWRGVLHGAALLRKGMLWRIGDGGTVKFWKDNWVFDAPLNQNDSGVHICDPDSVISSFYRDGWWDMEKLRAALPDELVQRVISCPVGFNSGLQDAQIWKFSSNGIFSVKSAYNMVFEGSTCSDVAWTFLWKLRIPPKLHIFFWLVFQGKILSNEQRVRRQLSLDASCGSCHWPMESILHILRDCVKAKKVWNALLNSSQSARFFTMDFQPWLRVNLMSKIVWADGIPWNLVFVFTCWYIWKWRNHYVFHGDEDLAFDSIQIITAAVKEWFKTSNVSFTKCAKVEAWFAWEPPPAGVFKLNVDGSRKVASGHIGAGGVLRDVSGDWCSGFAINLGKGQILEAELWGLFFGLRMAIAKGFNNLIVEMDSAVAIQLVQQHDSLTLHPLASLVSSCWQLMQQLEKCSMRHIFREKNSVADRLAAWSYNLDLGICVFDEAPSWIGTSLVEDLLGVSRPRLICVD